MTLTDRATDSVELADCVWQACVLEATARKPGNVHPGASFADLNYQDFLASARLIAPILARTPQFGVGPTVLSAVERTLSHARRNSNLGIVLLLAPLAAVPQQEPLEEGILSVLERLTQADADSVYQAIRLAGPGGMGEVEAEDISKPPSTTLRVAMSLAADRDTIAAQYTNGFQALFELGLPRLAAAEYFANNWKEAIIDLQLFLMSQLPDSLIARKCGSQTAALSSDKAGEVLAAGWPHTARGRERLTEFDRWLRADGNRRNPGTTADLVAACLFAGFREQRLEIPDLTSHSDINPSTESSV